jgi:hypothetical protein
MPNKKKQTKPDLHYNTHILKQQMIQALEKTLGIVSHACEIVGINRTTHYDWMKHDEEYKENVNSVSSRTTDFVESKLLENIKNNNNGAILFYLKCKAADRGYREKQEIEYTNTPQKLYGTQELIDEV